MFENFRSISESVHHICTAPREAPKADIKVPCVFIKHFASGNFPRTICGNDKKYWITEI